MPKLTAEERAELEARLADDEAEEDFEFDYSEGDRSIRLPWSRRMELPGLGFKGIPKITAVKDKDDKKPAARTGTVFGQRRTS